MKTKKKTLSFLLFLILTAGSVVSIDLGTRDFIVESDHYFCCFSDESINDMSVRVEREDDGLFTEEFLSLSSYVLMAHLHGRTVKSTK